MALNTNEWLNIVQILGGGALGTKLLQILLQMRDALRDLGSKEPPTGLFGTVARIEEIVSRHDTWLIQLRAKLGLD